MPTYVTLSNFTEQGFKDIKNAVKRSEAFKKAAKGAGVTVKELLWTQGQYDVVSIVEGSEEAIAALGLSIVRMGNVTGQTLLNPNAAIASSEPSTIETTSVSLRPKEFFHRDPSPFAAQAPPIA